jgi:acid phosphatase
MVPFSQLATDLANSTLPAFSIIVPDLNHDAHNGTLGAADDFLKNSVSGVLNYPAFRKDGLMIVTFDECDAAIGACSELVYTAMIGPNVKRGATSSNSYRHESTLRTILDAFAIKSFPGAANTTKPMADFF